MMPTHIGIDIIQCQYEKRLISVYRKRPKFDIINSKTGAYTFSGREHPLNEIMWLAVSEAERGKGYGRQLVESALNALDTTRDIVVQTFDRTVEEGKTARKLYAAFGFLDDQNGGLNPAGVPTVLMKRPGAKPTPTKSSQPHRLS